ncbi:transposase, partial [Escherichia coli]|uniref:transposase n=1 Tax=Escherichia coli TaxID=562 RepID=UPI0032E4AE5D
MPATRKYDAETQARAVRMYQDRMAEGGARIEVGNLLGINEATLRNWVRRDVGEGVTPPADDEAVDEEAGCNTRTS